MVNQTAQNDENNRGKNENEALLDALRPIWQGRQDSNLQPTVLETATLPLSYSPMVHAVSQACGQV
jgi:hypothetical protein